MAGRFDVVIIGSGVGGGCIAHVLAPTGGRIVILERGRRMPREDRNWDPEAVYADAAYKSDERWTDGSGRSFRPGQFYHVGGHTKVFGATMFRFRREDFCAHGARRWTVAGVAHRVRHARALLRPRRTPLRRARRGRRRPDGAAALGPVSASAAPPQSGDRRGRRAIACPGHEPVPDSVFRAGPCGRRLRALQHLRRFPLPPGCQGRRRDVPHRPGVAARERRTANGGPCCSPARRCEWPAHRGRRAGRRHASPGRSLRTGCGRRQQCCDPASLRPREAPRAASPIRPEWSGATT